jgi:hypothetical protein
MKLFIIRFATLAATGTLAGVLALAVSGSAAAANPPGTRVASQDLPEQYGPRMSPGRLPFPPESPFNEPTSTSPAAPPVVPMPVTGLP